MAEARELGREPSTEYTAKPTEEDLFVRVRCVHECCMGLWNCLNSKDWHCTIRGPSDTEFEGGLYHARIVLPPGAQRFLPFKC